MGGHGPAVKLGKDNASEWKAKMGVKLFWIYVVFYGAFVGIAAFSRETLKTPIDFLGGLNLATAYGMGLIVLALIMGLVYNKICTAKENELNKEETK